MKYVDEYRDPELARTISGEIAKLTAGRTLKLMEVCGGHTHTIYKHGIEDVLAQVRHSTLEKCREMIALRRATLEQCGDLIVAAGVAMAQAFAAGATLLAFGNGGSTTDAQDMVADLSDPPFAGCQPLPAIALTNDIAVGISTSGNSTNVLVALEQAKKQGLLTIAIAGYDGGKVARSAAVDFCITAASEYIPRIQEAQATAYHALIEVVFAKLRIEH